MATEQAVEMQVPTSPPQLQGQKEDVEAAMKEEAPKDLDVTKPEDAPQLAEMPKPWGKCMMAWLIVAGLVLGALGAVSGRTMVMFLAVCILCLLSEGFVAVLLARKFPWQGRAAVWAPVIVDGNEKRRQLLAVQNPEKREPVTVDGVERKSGYDGELYSLCFKSAGFKRTLSGEARADLTAGLKRVSILGAAGFVLVTAAILPMTMSLDRVKLDYAECDGATNMTECRLGVFQDTVVGEQCVGKPLDAEAADDRSIRTPSNLHSFVAETSMFGVTSATAAIFVSIGTLMNTMIYLQKGDMNMIKTMWGATAAFHIFNTLACFTGYADSAWSPSLASLSIALFHAIHLFLQELAAKPKVFARFRWNKLASFSTGLFVHFLVGIVLLVVLVLMDDFVIRFGGTLSPSVITTMLSCAIAVGNTVLQTVFSQLPEVPIRAAALQMAGYQFASYGKLRSYFSGLSTEELASSALTNFFMEILTRSLTMPVKAFQWNRNLKNTGPDEKIAQFQGCYMANLIISMASEQVAILATMLIKGTGNSALLLYSGHPLYPESSSDVLTAYFIQFSLEVLCNIIMLVICVSFFNFRLMPFFESLGPLFYIGLALSAVVTGTLLISPVVDCFYCELRDTCMRYAGTGAVMGVTTSF